MQNPLRGAWRRESGQTEAMFTLGVSGLRARLPPRMAISRCLDQGNAKIADVKFAAFPGRAALSALREAHSRFLCGGMDALAIGDFFIVK